MVFNSRDSLPKIKTGTCLINLEEYKSIRTHRIALYVNGDNETYFHSFRAVYIPKENKKLIRSKNIMTDYFRIQAYDSRIYGYISIGVIYFMMQFILLDCSSFFSKKYEKNDKIILKCFQ